MSRRALDSALVPENARTTSKPSKPKNAAVNPVPCPVPAKAEFTAPTAVSLTVTKKEANAKLVMIISLTL